MNSRLNCRTKSSNEYCCNLARASSLAAVMCLVQCTALVALKNKVKMEMRTHHGGVVT